MDDIIEQIKQANRIEDVIEETGVSLERKRGRYIRGKEHDSIVVDTVEQCYFWNSKNESGDIFTWLEKRRGWDFKTAAEWLAKRAKLPAPEWGKQDNEVRIAARIREDALTVAARWFVKRLRDSAAARDYCRGRGWTDETVQKAGLGFSGGMERKDLEGELDMHGIDKGHPARRAILGIPADMLIYPHVVGGRVRYLSCRSIEGKLHYNLPVDLIGNRQVYFNFVYGANEKICVIVEGQADAVTLAQYGIPAVALAGTSYKDHQGLLEELSKRHPHLYVGVDSDEAGFSVLKGNGKWPLADILGGMIRVIRWSEKDANDLLQKWLYENKNADEIKEGFDELLKTATPVCVLMAKWAGEMKGSEQDEAFERVFEILGKVKPLLIEKYKDNLSNLMGISLRQFNNMLRKAQGKEEEKEEKPLEIVETLGGYIGNYLIEYLYDEESETALFAYRSPEGKIDTANYLDIEGKRYIPLEPNSLIKSKGVMFPSKLGDKKATSELVAIIEAFIHQHYLLDDKNFGRLAAYYVLLTWVYDCFAAIPYLRATGDYGSGKSQLMERIGPICYRLIKMGSAMTSASLFRMLHEYRGTAFLDELDLNDGGDMTNDIIKILNIGAMANSPVIRMEQVVRADGTRAYEPIANNVYGPKLIAMRGEFRDKATMSRCLTIKLMGKETLELKMRGIKLQLDQAFYNQALAIRNLLLRWRLEKWQPEIALTDDLMDLEVPARLNQVTMPLKALAKDDPELMKDITTFVRALNEELVLERSMGLDARVMEALVAIREDKNYEHYLFYGSLNGHGMVYYTQVKHVAKVANDIIDEMNEETEEDEEDGGTKKRKTKGTTSHTVGKIIRQTLQLASKKTKNGYIVIYDDVRLAALKVKYGL